ncbi:MAG TPA: GldG family protein [Anaerolineales bacterium]
MAKKRTTSSSRYAVIGLVLAGLGCVATGGLALVRGSVALGLYTLAKPETLTRALAVSAGVLVIGLAVYGILNPAQVRRFLTGRQARYGSNALIMSLAFVGILVIVNWLVYQNPKKFDLSEGKQHTLAPETIQALDTLPGTVKAIAFYSTQYPTDTAKSLLSDFKSGSKGKFDYEFVDPNANPVLANQYGITGDGKIVLVMGEHKEIASYADENSLTQAMIRLISPQTRTVYFLTGHGEPDLKASDTTSMLRARQTLESKNYTVKELNLAATHNVPQDAKALIIAGATDPLLDQEVAEVGKYVAGGGSLIVLSDPALTENAAAAADPLSGYLQEAWGITLQNTVVIDLTSNQPFNAISASYSSTAPITSHTTSLTIMPQARSLAISTTPPKDVTLTPLILTSQQSWGETDLASLESKHQFSLDDKMDILGPLTLAASAENSTNKGRVVVFGNSHFARNEAFDAYANGEIFTNAVDWAAQEGNLINITPRTPVTRTFNPPSQLVFILILLGVVFLVPGLVLVAGTSSWLARRRHG